MASSLKKVHENVGEACLAQWRMQFLIFDMVWIIMNIGTPIILDSLTSQLKVGDGLIVDGQQLEGRHLAEASNQDQSF